MEEAGEDSVETAEEEEEPEPPDNTFGPLGASMRFLQ